MNPNMESLQGELMMKITGLLFLVSAVTRSVKYMCNQTNEKGFMRDIVKSCQ